MIVFRARRFLVLFVHGWFGRRLVLLEHLVFGLERLDDDRVDTERRESGHDAARSGWLWLAKNKRDASLTQTITTTVGRFRLSQLMAMAALLAQRRADLMSLLVSELEASADPERTD